MSRFLPVILTSIFPDKVCWPITCGQGDSKRQFAGQPLMRAVRFSSLALTCRFHQRWPPPKAARNLVARTGEVNPFGRLTKEPSGRTPSSLGGAVRMKEY